ncbi:MAG: NifB/NifX family molybdenum-iron cluster-binding protein [Candidatus Omnitrophica bacterium]|nr:NifB/NifX family molybdenum-iron cluster-binding protein [Candidatus Omnitrophota bacterium]MCK5081744.1 NifB/NifX family molybdenum-iron cluster-binding protein [Candidatus Omnitrophota bacterium]
MKIAISTDGNFVSGHFGRCPSFTIVDINNNEVVNKETIANPGHHPGYLPEFLHDQGVNCIVAGGMGQRAEALFSEKGIQAIVGVTGAIDEVVDKIAQGQLVGRKNTCVPETGKGYGLDKTICDHE